MKPSWSDVAFTFAPNTQTARCLKSSQMLLLSTLPFFKTEAIDNKLKYIIQRIRLFEPQTLSLCVSICCSGYKQNTYIQINRIQINKSKKCFSKLFLKEHICLGLSDCIGYIIGEDWLTRAETGTPTVSAAAAQSINSHHHRQRRLRHPVV